MSDETEQPLIRSLHDDDREDPLARMFGLGDEQARQLRVGGPWVIGAACLGGALGYWRGLVRAVDVAGADPTTVLFVTESVGQASAATWLSATALFGMLLLGYGMGRLGRVPRDSVGQDDGGDGDD